VLLRLSKKKSLTTATRKSLADTLKYDVELRKLRVQARKLTLVAQEVVRERATLAPIPAITICNCNNTQSLPGGPMPHPAAAVDPTVKRVFETTTNVVDFFDKVFSRNSIDDAGMTLMSSVHYGNKYNNACWNGSQMTYGDGDGDIFVDFSQGIDVVCHELMHGVTQHTIQLGYANEPGGLNESISDVFGTMFRQWKAGQPVTRADWLMGTDIMGPAAIKDGYVCLRDMARPGAKHCLTRQPYHYSKYKAGMDPHYSSGIPNLAFHKVAMAIGGNSWGKAGQIWYRALTGFGPSPNMRMRAFANRTRRVASELYPGDAASAQAVDLGWKQVGL
jgi:Zn-dependent metalloprotease